MTTLTKAAREALETLRLARDRIVNEGGNGWVDLANRCDKDYMALRAALDEAPGESAELPPPFMRVPFRDRPEPLFTADQMREYAARAMLAARPEAPTGAQKPLTRSQISRASGDAQIAFCLNKQPTYEVAFAREVERLHGIDHGKEGGA